MTGASSRSLRARAGSTAMAALAAAMLGSTSTACSASHADPDTTTTATVLPIVDGDTVDVVDDTRGRLRIRVLGIFPVK
jgi:micrococcal nuclease